MTHRPARWRLRDERGRYRRRPPIAEMPVELDRYGAVHMPTSVADRLRLGLYTVDDLVEYARTHLPRERALDYLAGINDGTTDGTLRLL